MKKKMDSAIKSRNDVLIKADEYLVKLAACTEELKSIQSEVEKQIAAITEKYAEDVATIQDLKVALEKDLRKFAKKKRGSIR